MRKAIMISLLLMVVCFVGCAALSRTVNSIAPSQVDPSGNVIPGSHTALPITSDTAGAIPYGSFVLNALLLGWNFVEKAKANKVKSGLIATVQAIEKAGQDPAIKDAIVTLKEDLSHAHDVAGVQPIIKDILAKI